MTILKDDHQRLSPLLAGSASLETLEPAWSSGESGGQQRRLDAAIGSQARASNNSPYDRLEAETTNIIPTTSYSAVEPVADSDRLQFVNLGLMCPIEAGEICNRWLNAFVPDPDQTAKQYSPNMASFILRILKAYAGTTVHGVGIPSFVHYTQLETPAINQPLCTCLSLVRTCDTLLHGAHVASAGLLQNEVDRLSQIHHTYSEMTLLSAYQACLIYSFVLHFWLRDESSEFLRRALMYLQELACATSREGLVCIEEQQGTRPKWESWIAAEAKRRTLYTMYLFDNVLSALDGLPTFLGTELRGLPAPASRTLWQARSRQKWEHAYNSHLVTFPEGGLRIDELWPIATGADEATCMLRRQRIDTWLEDLDEFGTMLYAVTSITHNLG